MDFFGSVHGTVSEFDELVHIEAKLGKEHHAETSGNSDFRVIDFNRLLDCAHQFFDDHCGVTALLEILEHNNELVAAPAGSDIGTPNGICNTLRSNRKHRIAGFVTMIVIDRLEVVKVDKDDTYF